MTTALDIMGNDSGVRLVTVSDVYGCKHRVREDHLDDAARVMLRRHTTRGRPFNIEDENRRGQSVMLHRGNIAS